MGRTPLGFSVRDWADGRDTSGGHVRGQGERDVLTEGDEEGLGRWTLVVAD